MPKKKQAEKSSPTSSQVHVPSTEEKLKKAEHNKKNIKNLLDALSQFFGEEVAEKVDPATADDAYPIVGEENVYGELPPDALLAIGAMDQYWPQAEGEEEESDDVKKKISIIKADKMKQIVYCVVYSPDEVDSQDDWMPAEEIEKSAHLYLEKYRVIGKDHKEPINAVPVESYIAPVDFQINDGPYGPQDVRKGSWVIGIKIKDAKIWQKVLDGEYQGVSIGGMGVRE